jgi:hypothetical protein
MSLGAYPIDDLIVRVAKQRLETLDFVSEVIRESRNIINWTPKDKQIILTKETPTRAEEHDTIGNPPGIAYTMTLNIYCHVLQSQVDDEPVDSLLSVIAADVVRAITAPKSWYRFDDAALNAELGDVERNAFDGSFDSIKVPVTVLYRVREDDPYRIQC